jgi:hypothetical protein
LAALWLKRRLKGPETIARTDRDAGVDEKVPFGGGFFDE